MDTPHLIVLVDAEEAFDWRKPFSRQSTCVDHFRHIERVQNVLDDAGIRPAYLCNYPVISDAFAADRLRGFSDDGRAEIGTHLHPWVTPPDIEEVSNRNSFLGNLPLTLQHQKLDMMQRTHERVFGVQPRMFMAGRYGLGADTLGLLTQNGFLVDVSIAASMDFATDGGPDYSQLGPEPFWPFERGGLLCMPVSGARIGHLADMADSHTINRFARSDFGQKFYAPALLSRIGALDLVRLTPEGYGLRDMIRLTETLWARGQRCFVLNFHSPSVEPGNTPYVRSDRDLFDFLERLREYLAWFTGPFGGRPTTPLGWREAHLSDQSVRALDGADLPVQWSPGASSDIEAGSAPSGEDQLDGEPTKA